MIGFCADGVVGNSNAEFYAFAGPGYATGQSIYYDENGEETTDSGDSIEVYTQGEHPMFVTLLPVERINNAS
jgi:hypothetical protein